MKKSALPTLLSVFILILCSACGKNPNREIIGYWMRGDGYTISFVDETTCSLGEGSPQIYKIYDKERLQIVDSSGNGVTEFVFNVDGDTLNIRLAVEEGFTEFTKNQDKQKKILEEVREWEMIEQEEKNLHNRIDEIQGRIDSYQKEINSIQKDIDWNNSAIENNKKGIVKWNEKIDEEYVKCQEAIDFGDDREYQERQRDDFITAYKESIQSCNERIAELETENSDCQEDITQLMSQISKLKKEIEKLQE